MTTFIEALDLIQSDILDDALRNIFAGSQKLQGRMIEQQLHI